MLRVALTPPAPLVVRSPRNNCPLLAPHRHYCPSFVETYVTPGTYLFAGCPSFCGSHFRFWLRLWFAHPVITAPSGAPSPLLSVVRCDLRSTWYLFIGRSVASVPNLVEGFVLTCYLLNLTSLLFALHHDFVSFLYTDSLAVPVYHLQHCFVGCHQFCIFSQFLKRLTQPRVWLVLIFVLPPQSKGFPNFLSPLGV